MYKIWNKMTDPVNYIVKFNMFSEKATNFFEIFTLLLTGTTQDKGKVKISQNFVAFSKYINFTRLITVDINHL